jgi:hypothetical protein
MKIYAISGTDNAPPDAWLEWAVIIGVTAAIFIATLRIKAGSRVGAHGTS